jgi:hypothetical protein
MHLKFERKKRSNFTFSQNGACLWSSHYLGLHVLCHLFRTLYFYSIIFQNWWQDWNVSLWSRVDNGDTYRSLWDSRINLKSYALFDLSWFALLSERQLEDIGRINVLWMETKTFHARKQPFWWMENYFLGWSHPSICHPLTSPLRWGYQNRNNWNKSLSVMRPQELSLKERERTRE